MSVASAVTWTDELSRSASEAGISYQESASAGTSSPFRASYTYVPEYAYGSTGSRELARSPRSPVTTNESASAASSATAA